MWVSGIKYWSQSAFREFPTSSACNLYVPVGRQLWVSALAWRKGKEGLCNHGSCDFARFSLMPGEACAGEDSRRPLLHWSIFWSIGRRSSCCVVLLGDCYVSSKWDWSTMFILQPVLGSHLLFPTVAHHTESLEIELFSPAVCWWKSWKKCPTRNS